MFFFFFYFLSSIFSAVQQHWILSGVYIWLYYTYVNLPFKKYKQIFMYELYRLYPTKEEAAAEELI